MFNLNSITNENNKKHNEKRLYIPDHPYIILITGGSGSGKTNTLLTLINEQGDIDKIYLYPKDLSEPKYEYLIKKRKYAGTKNVINSNAFIIIYIIIIMSEDFYRIKVSVLYKYIQVKKNCYQNLSCVRPLIKKGGKYIKR